MEKLSEPLTKVWEREKIKKKRYVKQLCMCAASQMLTDTFKRKAHKQQTNSSKNKKGEKEASTLVLKSST